MKKISFLIDEETDRILKTIARCEDISKASVIRNIVTKEARNRAHKMGFLNKHQIEEYINK